MSFLRRGSTARGPRRPVVVRRGAAVTTPSRTSSWVWAHWSWSCPSCGCSRHPCRGRPTRGCPGSRRSGRRTRPSFNYTVASGNLPLVQFYANSIITVTAVTLGYLFFSSLVGYVFAKGRFPFRGPLFLLFLTTLFVPFPMQMIPLYLQMKDMGLNNSLAGLVVPFLVGGFGIFLMRQAMMSIPDDLVDAARLDGASEFRIFRTVMLPLVAARAGDPGRHRHAVALERRAVADPGQLRSQPVHGDPGARDGRSDRRVSSRASPWRPQPWPSCRCSSRTSSSSAGSSGASRRPARAGRRVTAPGRS